LRVSQSSPAGHDDHIIVVREDELAGIDEDAAAENRSTSAGDTGRRSGPPGDALPGYSGGSIETTRPRRPTEKRTLPGARA
jgi:hypothetical protein